MPGIAGFFLASQVTPFVILFIERDGSTYLTSALTSHPQVKAVYERFAVLRQQNKTAADQLAWAREMFSRPIIGRVAAMGFKTKLVDVLDLDAFAALLKEKRVHVIRLQRLNRVKAVVSRINAKRLYEKSGTWNLYNEADRMPPADVDFEQFARFLREREQADEQLIEYVNALQLPTLPILYEDILQKPDAVNEELFRFLRLPPHKLEAKTLKNTSDDLRDAVLNFDALRARYAGTSYEAQFDEVLVQQPA
jgi:LPS sulfotransferase NodH